jgi:arylsulfatase A-like enzyme
MKFLAAFSALLLAAGPMSAEGSKPNIVYLLVDDMGFADCGFNGSKEIRTPNIDALSTKGTVFENYYVQPLCSAARACLLTGRLPIHHGIYGALKVESKFGLPLDAKEAVRILEQQPKDKPLFLYVPFNAVHGPFQVPASYTEPYKSLRPTRATMAGMLAAVDEAIGEIVAALQSTHMDTNTLIVFSSDNGGVQPGVRTMNTPLREGKGTIYEGGVRSAAFAVWPGKIPAGKKVSPPVQLADWYPTLVKLTGADASQSLPPDGKDIMPLLTEGRAPDRDALLIVGTSPRRAAIRMGDWKLLFNPNHHARGKRGDPDEEEDNSVSDSLGDKIELYNLANDISESKDLAASQPERVKDMRERLEAMMKEAVTPARNATP